MLQPNRLQMLPEVSRTRCLHVIAGAIGWAVIGVASPARADGWGGAVSLASDKVYRGVSESDGRPVLLLDLDRHTDTGWAAALGLAGPVYPDQGGAVELTLGFSKSSQLTADWTLQSAISRHEYPGDARARSYTRTDASLLLAWQGRVFLSLAVSPDTSGYDPAGGEGRRGRTETIEFGLHQRLVGRLALDAGIGYFDQRALRDWGYGGYAYGSVGLGWGVGPVQASLTYIGSQAAARDLAWPSRAGPRWVAALLWNF